MTGPIFVLRVVCVFLGFCLHMRCHLFFRKTSLHFIQNTLITVCLKVHIFWVCTVRGVFIFGCFYF